MQTMRVLFYTGRAVITGRAEKCVYLGRKRRRPRRLGRRAR